MKYNYLFFLILILINTTVFAQKKQSKNQKKTTTSAQVSEKYFSEMKYRSVGPSRGGRATAITGIPEEPFTFFMGTTGGGVWKTTDAGTNWENISDGQIEAGSIGAIEVAPSDNQVMYVGTGSACARGNISAGIGMYKTTNGGYTWKFIGLPEAGQIAKVIVHPKNPDLVYVAALGNIFKPNSERGVFRSNDGGDSWEKILYVNDSTGAVDMVINPDNPRIMYAAMWRAERKPWTMIDGGDKGGIYKTEDGGKNWEKLEKNLPKGILGRIGLAISPSNPQRIWALIVAKKEEDSGLYRTENAGKSWQKINRDHRLTQRGWYYTHITADPKDPNTVYVNNVQFLRSVDGGEHFSDVIRTPHGDNHGVWINPNNTNIMINCNDGGANVSLNSGKSWSEQLNQPTSEFYRVTVDNQFPYRLYAGQQDNTTISIPSKQLSALSNTEHWFEVGGGECADVAVDPRNPNIVYATSYSGEITYTNLENGQQRQLTAYPHYTEGTRQADLKYRWQWNYPVLVSQHNPDEIYQGSNYVHRSTNQGQTWEVISDDLTTGKAANLDIPGGPVQHDGTGVEIYSTIFALEESPLTADELWTGSDDGLVHITRDAGKTWQNITPIGLPKEATINKIELSTHAPGRAFIAAQRYRLGDFLPYIYRTNDFGKTWVLLTKGNNGIPTNHFVRAIAEDPAKKGLLYAGTEFGMYVSFDDGGNWQPFQLNMPHVPITDMEVHENDLVISTQGRAFWILDDLTPLHQLNDNLMAKNQFLYTPRDAYRTSVGGWSGTPAEFYFYFKEKPDSTENVKFEITDKAGNNVKTYASNPEEGESKLFLQEGMNHITWDLKYEGPEMAENFVAMVFSSDAPGPYAVPGEYQIKLSAGDWQQTETFNLKADPRWENVSTEDYQKQFDLAQDISKLITKSQRQIKNIRSIRKQIKEVAHLAELAGKGKELTNKANELATKLTAVEDSLFQNKIEVSQDEINYPRKFTNHIARLYQVVIGDHYQPTGGMIERFDDLKKEYEKMIAPLDKILTEDLKAYNELVKTKEINPVIIPYKTE
ncbi:VPS10 domain-containing protein [Chondrinema litorale]|uniref:VPS10 domain-containing protein n=1 Tax=Chondrinema litorale TaxID=2994555 RepID=UPI00254377E8|nr:glycosyl hydrolase [Chondrinema litorale]UZR99316.1 glycosyl hydrolase [Chondrinema litorale]